LKYFFSKFNYRKLNFLKLGKKNNLHIKNKLVILSNETKYRQMNSEKFIIQNDFFTSDKTVDIINPFTQKKVKEVYKTNEGNISTALEYLSGIFDKYKSLPTYIKSEILEKTSTKIENRKEEFAQILTEETGKPVKFSRLETERAIFTFRTGAEEAKRIEGEVMNLDLIKGSENKFAMIRRFPLGIIFAITPWNFPLNLVAHKLAPALACGNVVLLKPASSSLCCGIEIVKTIRESCLELGLDFCPVNVITSGGNEIDNFVADKRVKMISFTGSPVVGWELKKKLNMQKVSLELGGNAGVIVDDTADLELAVNRITLGAFAQAGQSCISVQRVFVHKNIYGEFLQMIKEKAENLKTGNPFEDDTIVGPMINIPEAKRVEKWIEQATDEKAEILTGGKRKDAVIIPTIMTKTKNEHYVNSKEVFAPLMTVREFSDFTDAVYEVDNSDYGLQAGIFTKNMDNAFLAYNKIEAGGIIINDVATYRMDSMPYGGMKQSGIGKEGVKYAIEEMTERKILVIS
jgi:acyl-CoA reductase-like NAD-dependent aldehyde dehydrogenase